MRLLKKFSLNAVKISVLLLCQGLFSGCEEKKDSSQPVSSFTEITDQVNLNFVHNPAVDGSFYLPEITGAGGAFFDFDNDGDLDIYLVNGNSHGGKQQKESTKNQLFRQEPAGSFINITDKSGLGDEGYGMGVAAGDYDNDGFVDIYVTNAGADALYRNNGNGTFSDVTEKSGIDNADWGVSVIFLDYNLDNYLDIFVTNYVKYDSSVYCTDRIGNRDYCGPQGYHEYADKLFKNNGNGTFSDVSVLSGIGQKKSAGLGVISADFNNDGYPDIYVSNDRQQNHLWMNQKDGTFKDRAVMLGAGYNGSGMAEGSMGIAVGDIDNDADMDIFISHFLNESNTLYRNMGEMGFQDDTAPAALALPSLPYTGFGTGFFDFDCDGDLDLAIANGRVIRGPLLTSQKPAAYWDYYAEPNFVFENDGKGTFKNVSPFFSEFSARIENSRGLVFGDIDNDGDIDLLVNNEGSKARLYRNDFQPKKNWITIRAVIPELQRDAYGAKIKVKMKDETVVRVVNPGYSYCASNDPRVHFGLGDFAETVDINIDWPGGLAENISGAQINQIVTIHKGMGIRNTKN